MARVQVLRLLETFDLEDLHAAVKTALCMGPSIGRQVNASIHRKAASTPSNI